MLGQLGMDDNEQNSASSTKCITVVVCLLLPWGSRLFFAPVAMERLELDTEPATEMVARSPNSLVHKPIRARRRRGMGGTQRQTCFDVRPQGVSLMQAAAKRSWLVATSTSDYESRTIDTASLEPETLVMPAASHVLTNASVQADNLELIKAKYGTSIGPNLFAVNSSIDALSETFEVDQSIDASGATSKARVLAQHNEKLDTEKVMRHALSLFQHCAQISSALRNASSYLLLIVLGCVPIVFMFSLGLFYYYEHSSETHDTGYERSSRSSIVSLRSPTLLTARQPRRSTSKNGENNLLLQTATRAARESSGDPDCDDGKFCPILIVPENTDCTIVVPIVELEGYVKSFDVFDRQGRVVMSVSARDRASGKYQSAAVVKTLRRLMIETVGGHVLAQCCAAKPSAPQGVHADSRFHLLRSTGSYFATLSQEGMGGEDYALETLAGDKFRFSGDFERHAVVVQTTAGKKIARVEPCQVNFDAAGSYYRLKVAPCQDVGLILCSLLCLDHLRSV